MSPEEELRIKRIKVYLRPLLPVNPPLIDNLDKSLINIDKSQLFVHSDDVYREIFSYILLEKSKQIQAKPTYRVITLDDLVSQHFTNEILKPLCRPDYLFIVHNSGYIKNPILGPVYSKITEERNLLGKPTYMYFKGSYSKAKSAGFTEGRNVVNYTGDYTTGRPLPISEPIQFRKYDSLGSSMSEEDDKPTKPKRVAPKPKRAKRSESEEKEREKNLDVVTGVTDSSKYGGLI